MSPEIWTILKLLRWATTHFKTLHVDHPRSDAEILLSHALGLARVDLYVQYDRPLEPKELAAFKVLVKRRMQREPVAYIVGEKGFWKLDLEVTRDVLIPRPETELVVEAALSVIPSETSQSSLGVLDMGTGSGAIVLALAQERPGHRFYGIDCSYGAVCVAQKNARKHGLGHSVAFFQGQWFDALQNQGSRFDVIVTNPPYIRQDDLRTLAPEIFQFEPLQALTGGHDGLDAFRVIVGKAASYLNVGGWLIMEIGYDQGSVVQRLIAATASFDHVSVTKDHSGLDRVIRARATKSSNPPPKNRRTNNNDAVFFQYV
jgi:release factor glutamine methyltransferase